MVAAVKSCWDYQKGWTFQNHEIGRHEDSVLSGLGALRNKKDEVLRINALIYTYFFMEK